MAVGESYNDEKHVESSGIKGNVESLENVAPGYGMERNTAAIADIKEEDNPNIHQHMNSRLFLSLLGMSFLWVGSQIPLYMWGGVLPNIYSDIGGSDRYVWMIIGYLIPNASLCPFVGALSDMFGRRMVAMGGQALLIIGPIVTATANSMNIAIAGQVLSGLGAGLNELIALAGTAEMVPIRKRGSYVGAVVFTILPFCPSVLWAQLIQDASSWRFVGLVLGIWNFIGLLLVAFFYKDPARLVPMRPKKDILREVDYMGGFLSTVGVTLFMMGMQWGAEQYSWTSAQVLVPFLLGFVIIIAFFVWEAMFAKYPMCPPALFSKAKRTMIAILLITFFSGANFFVLLLFWPTQVYNVYGNDPTGIGIRALPIGFGIIGGAAIALVMIPILGGRTTPLMIFSCALMTAGTGALSAARTDNLNAVYAIVTIASLGVGAVIIPCSIIAQIVCPPDLIGTITAVTLAIRYVGGAIGFTAYYNIFYKNFTENATANIPPVLLSNGVITGLSDIGAITELVTELITLAGEARFGELREIIANNPNVGNKENALALLQNGTQEAFALAYRWPYWMSIAFGGVCLVCSFFLKDVRKFMLPE